MTWKKAMAIVCVLVCLLGLSACTTSNTSDKESLQQQTQTETAVSGEDQTENTQHGDPVTDSEKKNLKNAPSICTAMASTRSFGGQKVQMQ